MTAASTDPVDGIEGDALYFGTWREPGHFAWLPGMNRHPYDRQLAIRLDSGRWQAQHAQEGEAKVTKLSGWTILSFPDYSVDRRGGCHSTFALRGDHDFAAALALARQRFPQVFERFTFEVTETDDAAK
jgi:hypothetical protein